MHSAKPGRRRGTPMRLDFPAPPPAPLIANRAAPSALHVLSRVPGRLSFILMYLQDSETLCIVFIQLSPRISSSTRSATKIFNND
jgi:hypothetical protein